MQILVTGGAGFIGSHIVDQLVAADHDVVVLDSLASDVHAVRPEYLNPAARYIIADVSDPDAWIEAAQGVDAVCHQAARVGLGVDFADVRRYVSDNDTGTAVGLWVLDRLGFTGRFVLASSMVVYGEGRYLCASHGEVRPAARSSVDLDEGRFEPTCPRCADSLQWAQVPEDAPLDPRNVYAATKLHQEHLCNAFGQAHGVTVTSLRYHNVYGPRMPRDTPYAGVASIFRSAVLAGEAPRVLEDGGQTRDFVHVEDVARANVVALTGDRPHAGALNIASGDPHTVLDLAGALCGGHGLNPVVVGGGRIGDVRHIVASAALAESTIGFRATVGFDEGMRDFLRSEMRRSV